MAAAPPRPIGGLTARCCALHLCVLLLAIPLFTGSRCTRAQITGITCESPHNFSPGAKWGTLQYHDALLNIKDCLERVKDKNAPANPACKSAACLCLLVCWLTQKAHHGWSPGCTGPAMHALQCGDDCIVFIVCASPPVADHWEVPSRSARYQRENETSLNAIRTHSLTVEGGCGSYPYNNCWHDGSDPGG